MNPKKIILCPNPSRDRGMAATKAAQKILHEIGFRTVVCSPFRDQRDGAFADFDVHPLQAELRSADLLLTFGGDGTILHLAKLRLSIRFPYWASIWEALALSRNWRPASWSCFGSWKTGISSWNSG